MTGLPLGDYRLFQWPFDGFLPSHLPYVSAVHLTLSPASLWIGHGVLLCLAGTQHAWFIRLLFSTLLIVVPSDPLVQQLKAR
jgi:hypothetical protein